MSYDFFVAFVVLLAFFVFVTLQGQLPAYAQVIGF